MEWGWDLISTRICTTILFGSCLFFSGCSFHSNQLEALRTLFRVEAGPQAQWIFSWGEVTEKVFAINAAPSILFANSGGLLVRFNGSFIESVDGLMLSNKKDVAISITKTKLDTSEIYSYRGLAAEFGDVHCELPSEVSSELPMGSGVMQTIEISQKCSVGDKFAQQRIMLNQSRQLVGVQFVLHPAHEPATIRYNPI